MCIRDRKRTLHIRVSTWFVAAAFLCSAVAPVVTSQTTIERKPKAFASAQEAADALIDAAEKFDEMALAEILGPDSYDIIHTGEPARDREAVSYTHLRAHETPEHLVCRLLLEKKK